MSSGAWRHAYTAHVHVHVHVKLCLVCAFAAVVRAARLRKGGLKVLRVVGGCGELGGVLSSTVNKTSMMSTRPSLHVTTLDFLRHFRRPSMSAAASKAKAAVAATPSLRVAPSRRPGAAASEQADSPSHRGLQLSQRAPFSKSSRTVRRAATIATRERERLDLDDDNVRSGRGVGPLRSGVRAGCAKVRVQKNE